MDDKDVFKTYYFSPVGWLQICGTEEFIISVLYCAAEDDSSEYLPDVVVECVKQLDEYFKKERKIFDIPVYQEGTPNMQLVWKEIYNLPYGETISYKMLEKATGNIKASRAFGKASSNNNINIIVPCHRVLGKKVSLKGYSGGLNIREFLINHEKSNL